MQTKYLFSGRFYKSRETDLRPGEEIPLCVPNNRLRLHNSYHSRFPAIDLFPGKVYSCFVININTLKRRCGASRFAGRKFCRGVFASDRKSSDLTICIIIHFIVFVVICVLQRLEECWRFCWRVKQLFIFVYHLQLLLCGSVGIIFQIHVCLRRLFKNQCSLIIYSIKLLFQKRIRTSAEVHLNVKDILAF